MKEYFDKIILQHQEELNLRYKNKLQLNLSNTTKPNQLQFLVMEDMTENVWYVYSAEKSNMTVIPFGSIVSNVMNEYLAANEKSVYHNKLKTLIDELGYSDFDYRKQFYEDNKKDLNTLLFFIQNLPKFRKEAADLQALKNDMLVVWKNFRYMNYANCFSEISSLKNSTMSDLDDIGYLLTEDEKKEILELTKKEAAEMQDSIHRLANKVCFIYHDFISWKDDKNNLYFGRAFVTSSILYAFSLDLFHILVDWKVEGARICKRCGQLYFSNNNKSKYCEDCQEAKNDIRNENRKNNPARYLHKRILDKMYLYSSKEECESFRLESNYYWNIIQGKNVSNSDKYNCKIETLNDYIDWLNIKLKSINK